MHLPSSKTPSEQVRAYQNRKKDQPISVWSAYGIVGELGYLIAIPAVLFGFGGAYLDKYLNTSPIFLIIGFMVAACCSGLAVRQSIKRLVPPEDKA